MTREEFLTKLPELTARYKPSRDVINRIANIKLLMIIGPSGVGKTTLMNKLSMPFVPSDTTRPRRPGEVDGVDYLFHQDYAALAQDIKNGHFLQIVIGVGGDLYATRGTSYPDNGMAVMAVVAGVIPLFRQLGFKDTLSAFITPPSFSEWQRRLSTHNLAQQQLDKRISEGKRSLEFALSDSQTHLILNDEIDLAAEQLKGLITGKHDINREEKAKIAAQGLLNELD